MLLRATVSKSICAGPRRRRVRRGPPRRRATHHEGIRKTHDAQLPKDLAARAATPNEQDARRGRAARDPHVGNSLPQLLANQRLVASNIIGAGLCTKRVCGGALDSRAAGPQRGTPPHRANIQIDRKICSAARERTSPCCNGDVGTEVLAAGPATSVITGGAMRSAGGNAAGAEGKSTAAGPCAAIFCGGCGGCETTQNYTSVPALSWGQDTVVDCTYRSLWLKVGTFEESRIFKILRFKNIQAVRLKNLEESVWNTSWSLWAHGRKCEAHARTHHKNLTSILSPGQRVYTPDPFGTCSDREYLWIPG